MAPVCRLVFIFLVATANVKLALELLRQGRANEKRFTDGLVRPAQRPPCHQRLASRRARRHPYVGKVFRKGLTAIRDEILARPGGAAGGDVEPLFLLLVRADARTGGRGAGRRRAGG
jgi:hypothetical protein